MYNRLFPDHNCSIQEFLNGVNQFDEFARRKPQFQSGGKYRCPRTKCKNKVYLTPDEVKMHLMQKGFVKGHWCLISHGEVEPQQYDFGYSTSELPKAGGSSYINHDDNESYIDHMEYMISDAVLANQNVRNEEPSTCQESFYNMVQVAQ